MLLLAEHTAMSKLCSWRGRSTTYVNTMPTNAEDDVSRQPEDETTGVVGGGHRCFVAAGLEPVVVGKIAWALSAC